MQPISASTLSALNSIISSLGTVATVTIAARALSSWKKQLKTSDRRELSHSMFDVLVRFVQLNRQFRFKCESWCYNEKIDEERSKLRDEILEAMSELEGSLLKLYLLSDITEKQFEKFQRDLNSLVSMIGHIQLEIVAFHYLDEKEKTAELRMSTMIKTLRPHLDLLTSFQKESMALLRSNFV